MAPPPPPTDNSGLAADAAKQESIRSTFQTLILQQSDTSAAQLVSDMNSYGEVSDREIADLTNEKNNLTNALSQGPMSPAIMQAKVNQIKGVLQQIQKIKNDQAQVSKSYALQAAQIQREQNNINRGAIPVSAVDFTPENFGSGQAAYTGTNGYIASAISKAGITNPTAVQNWTKGMMVAAPRLSSTFNPSAVDKSDSNAFGPKQVDGAPLNADRGAFQMTPATFAQYHVAGTSTDMNDPVAEGAAAMNYVEHRYDVNANGANLASNVQEFDPSRAPMGY